MLNELVISQIKGIKVAGIAAAVSNHWTSIEQYADSEENAKIIKKFIKKTGVKGRYEAGVKQTTSDFCFSAADKLLREKNFEREKIGILVFVTQTSDYGIPATACILQKRLGLTKECLAFDVNLGCSGFTCGLNIAASLLQNSNSMAALLLAGDTSAKERDPKYVTKEGHSATMLFGDSGTATLLVKDEAAEEIKMISRTDGNGYKAIISPYGGWRNPEPPMGANYGTIMDDVTVFNFATSEVPTLLQATMDLSKKTVADYDCLVLHQANLFIMKRIAKLTGFPLDKMLVSLDVFGNTSSSSVPISLVKEYGETTGDRQLHALMCGFGVGLSWSTVDCYINEKDILPLIHTDEYFEDGYMSVK